MGAATQRLAVDAGVAQDVGCAVAAGRHNDDVGLHRGVLQSLAVADATGVVVVDFYFRYLATRQHAESFQQFARVPFGACRTANGAMSAHAALPRAQQLRHGLRVEPHVLHHLEGLLRDVRPSALVVGGDGQLAGQLVELPVETDAYLPESLVGPHGIAGGQRSGTAQTSSVDHHHLPGLVDAHIGQEQLYKAFVEVEARLAERCQLLQRQG